MVEADQPFRQARNLEEADISTLPLLDGMFAHGVDPYGGMRGIQRREEAQTGGMLPGQPPTNQSAPIVPNYGECLLAEAIGEPHDIGRKVVEIIVADALGLVKECGASERLIQEAIGQALSAPIA